MITFSCAIHIGYKQVMKCWGSQWSDEKFSWTWREALHVVLVKRNGASMHKNLQKTKYIHCRLQQKGPFSIFYFNISMEKWTHHCYYQKTSTPWHSQTIQLCVWQLFCPQTSSPMVKSSRITAMTGLPSVTSSCYFLPLWCTNVVFFDLHGLYWYPWYRLWPVWMPIQQHSSPGSSCPKGIAMSVKASTSVCHPLTCLFSPQLFFFKLYQNFSFLPGSYYSPFRCDHSPTLDLLARGLYIESYINDLSLIFKKFLPCG